MNESPLVLGEGCAPDVMGSTLVCVCVWVQNTHSAPDCRSINESVALVNIIQCFFDADFMIVSPVLSYSAVNEGL